MTPPRTDGSWYRPDLEGLRGVAILLVLLCHVRIPGAEAGFVGVDVFFVLSGFLITGLLVDEHERTGRIGLGAFYARRARRILPAAVLVLATTLLAARFVVSPLDLRRIADDGLAASLSLANMRFALDATDYFGPVDASPMLHFWSLAVEEQFYLLWPILLLTVARNEPPRLAMAALATAVLAGSFILCSALTDTSSAWAYFSLPTRAWQLAAGGLLALGSPLLGRLPHAVAAAVGWLGAAAAGGESRGDRADDGLSRPGFVAADARRGRPDRFRWTQRIARIDRPREGTAAVARSDLVLAVLVALADPGPRAGGARLGRGD